jgi:hypothetical protein
MSEEKGILGKMTLAQKVLAATTVIITTLTAIFAGGHVLIKEIKQVVREISVENIEETREQIEALGFLTTDDFVETNAAIQDSLYHLAQFNREALNYTLSGQAKNLVAIKRTLKNDSILDSRLNGITFILDSIRGTSEMSLKYQKLLHQRDSALSVALHIENQIQEQLTLEKILRDNEENLEQIENRIQSEKKNKIIKVKRHKPRKKQEFQERIIFGGN